MQNELEKLVDLPEGKLVFTNEQIQFLLDNIGNLNPHIRDNLVYTLFFQKMHLNKNRFR